MPESIRNNHKTFFINFFGVGVFWRYIDSTNIETGQRGQDTEVRVEKSDHGGQDREVEIDMSE